MSIPKSEIEITANRLLNLQQTQLTPMTLSDIHGYIFDGLYPWAGQMRETDLWKGRDFCPNKYLNEMMSGHMHYMSSNIRKSCDSYCFFEILAKDYARLNWLHPFPEGNGRAQREWLRQQLLQCGYVLDLHPTRYEDMLNASNEGCNKNYEPLIRIFSRCIFRLPQPETYYQKLPYIAILSCDDIELGIQERYC